MAPDVSLGAARDGRNAVSLDMLPFLFAASGKGERGKFGLFDPGSRDSTLPRSFGTLAPTPDY